MVAGPQAPLPRRLLGFRRGLARARAGAELLDAHFALYAAAPLLLGGLGGIPSVFHFQGPWADENVAAGDSSRLRHRLRAALERLVHARIDAHVVLSSAFRRVLVERYRVAPWGVHVLAPGVDLELFTPGDRERGAGAARARPGGVRGGLHPPAGPPDGPGRAARRLGRARGCAARGLGAAAGRRRAAARAAERARRRSRRWPGRVRVLGRVSDAELIDAYRAADVAVVPTVALEGYGLVVLEAAACGTPSVVSDVGGLAEAALSLDPHAGRGRPGDARALAGRLRRRPAGELPGRERVREFAERSLVGGGGRPPPLAVPLAAGAAAGCPREGRVPRPRRPPVGRGDRADAPAAPHCRGVNVHVILGEDGPLADRLVKAGVSVEVMPIAPAARDLRREQVRPGAGALGSAWSTATYILRLAHRLRRLSARPRPHQLPEGGGLREHRRPAGGGTGRVARPRPRRRGLHPAGGGAAGAGARATAGEWR